MEKLVTPALLPFRKPLGALALLIVAAAVSGCAESSANGDPGARSLPVGQSCQSIRAELNRLNRAALKGKYRPLRKGAGSARVIWKSSIATTRCSANTWARAATSENYWRGPFGCLNHWASVGDLRPRPFCILTALDGNHIP